MKLVRLCVILLSCLLVSACGGDSPSPALLTSLGIMPIDPPREVPDIRFFSLDESPSRLSDHRGSVILLNFWASWCPPCRAEMPAMGRLAEALRDKDFVLIPVNVKESSALVLRFVEEFHVDFPVYLDPDAESAESFGISGLPTSILIDKEGFGVGVVTGGVLEWDDPKIIKALADWAG